MHQQHGIDGAARLDWAGAAIYQACKAMLLEAFLSFARVRN